MTAPGIDFDNLFDKLVSHQAASGFFEIVARHEPKANPGPGITAASWFQQLAPAAKVSGLAITSVRAEFVTRIYTSMLAEDQDEIDPTVLRAVGHLFQLYSEDFELGGTIFEVDLFAAHGPGLLARAGYLRQGQTLYRVVDVTTPLIIVDVFDQIPS